MFIEFIKQVGEKRWNAIQLYLSTNVRFYLSYDIKIILNLISDVKISLCTQRCYRRHFIHVTLPENLENTSGLSILMHDVISLSNDKILYCKCFQISRNRNSVD